MTSLTRILLAGATVLSVFATAREARAETSAPTAVPSLQHFASTQLKEFVKFREDFTSAMGDRLAVDFQARRQLRELDQALAGLRASLHADEAHPSTFTSTELKADLFTAQEAAQDLLETGVESELALAR